MGQTTTVWAAVERSASRTRAVVMIEIEHDAAGACLYPEDCGCPACAWTDALPLPAPSPVPDVLEITRSAHEAVLAYERAAAPTVRPARPRDGERCEGLARRFGAVAGYGVRRVRVRA